SWGYPARNSRQRSKLACGPLKFRGAALLRGRDSSAAVPVILWAAYPRPRHGVQNALDPPQSGIGAHLLAESSLGQTTALCVLGKNCAIAVLCSSSRPVRIGEFAQEINFVERNLAKVSGSLSGVLVVPGVGTGDRVTGKP